MGIVPNTQGLICEHTELFICSVKGKLTEFRELKALRLSCGYSITVMPFKKKTVSCADIRAGLVLDSDIGERNRSSIMWARDENHWVEVSTGTSAKCARGCSTETLIGIALEDNILNVMGRLGVLLEGIVAWLNWKYMFERQIMYEVRSLFASRSWQRSSVRLARRKRKIEIGEFHLIFVLGRKTRSWWLQPPCTVPLSKNAPQHFTRFHDCDRDISSHFFAYHWLKRYFVSPS